MGGGMSDGARLRSVLVVGAGAVGLAAAIALRRALPDAAIDLVQLPVDPDGWIDRLGAASPEIHKFHRQIGLDPRLFVQRAQAEPVHIRHYRRSDGTTAREASTPTIQFVEGVPLHHIWLRHRAEAQTDLPDFAAMLLAIRESREDEGGFGARYDPAAYRALLEQMAAALNIARHDTSDIGIETKGDSITGVTTVAGETLTADLYIDAAGPRSRLLTAMGADWQDWAEWLPAFGLSVAPDISGNPGEESIDWQGARIAWQTRRWRAEIALDPAIPAPGRLTRFWADNAVAIGEAAVRVPSIDGTVMGLALDDIMRLVALLPRPGSAGFDRAEYDRRTHIAHDALADWSCFCVQPMDARRSVALAETLAAFAARGRVAIRELDPVQPGQWLARLMALGPEPQRIDPTALALSEEIVRSTIARGLMSPIIESRVERI